MVQQVRWYERPDAKWLKELEAQTTRLKKLLAEQVFENDVIKYALRKKWSRLPLR